MGPPGVVATAATPATGKAPQPVDERRRARVRRGAVDRFRALGSDVAPVPEEEADR